VFKQLHAKGVGAEIKATPVMNPDDERKLWTSGVLNLTSPIGLLRAVFFYNGKNFCLRGGQEQRNLKLSQLCRETSIVNGKELSLYRYCEFGSKNRQGGLSSLNLQNKVVRQYENTTESGVCHVKILDRYLEDLPPEAVDKDVFYLTPLPKVPADPTKPWFKTVPVGKNRLNMMLKEMCAEAGITTNYTNHSLRAYGATTMFQAGVPEKLIKQRTGHRSLESLHQYEHTSESQLLDVSNVVSSDQNSNHNQMLSDANLQVSTASDIVPYNKGPSPHQMLSVTQSASLTSSYSSNQEPLSPTFVFNSCNFSSCPITFAGNANCQSSQSGKRDDLDDLLECILVEQLFDY